MTQQQPQQAGQGNRPGQMTAVMRAVMATGPKVLRIGLVQSGRVLEERIIKQRTHVTAGPSEKNMFVVAASTLPGTFRLFELVGNDYCLNFVDGMDGRVALPTGISELSVLKGQARRTPQGAYQIRLTEDSRGKVVVGDTTFLFQFVAPPPVQPKPQLPVSVTRGASNIDWTTTMIAALSFLLHFMMIGAIYSDWLDPIVDDEVNIAGLLDSVKALPPPPTLDQPEPTETEATDEGEEEAAEEESTGKQANNQPAGAMSTQQKAALTRELDDLKMAMIGALSGEGPALAGVLTKDGVPMSSLDAAAASGKGVSSAGGLSLAGGGGPLKPGAGGSGLKNIGKTGKGAGGTGKKVATKGPRGTAAVGGAAVSGGAVPGAAGVVARLRGRFRACYMRELASNPDARGTVRLTIRVGPSGAVQGVSASASGNLGSAVGCIQSRASGARFKPPEGGSAVVVVPVTLIPQN